MTETAYATTAIIGSVLLLSLMVEARLWVGSAQSESPILTAARTMLFVAAAALSVGATYLAVQALVDGVDREVGGVLTAALFFTVAVMALNLGKAVIASLSTRGGA